MSKPILVCAACCSDSDWVDSEKIIRVTGQEGNVPEVVNVMICDCGHKQEC